MSCQALPRLPISPLLISQLQLLFSSILSHPLHFSYFVFFSPYLLKLLSLLSPLFITTSLLLLGFFTISPVFLHENCALELPESPLGFFLWTFHLVVQILRPSKTDNEDEDRNHFEEFEAFKMMLDASTSFFPLENSDEVSELKTEELCSEEKTVEIALEETPQPNKEEAKRLQGLLKELDEFEKSVYDVEAKNVELPSTNYDQVEVYKVSEEKKDAIARDISSTVETRTDNGGEYTPELLETPSLRMLGSNIGRYGSMRRERNWNRTLACKLFEERRNVDGGGEGMDSLWETYESDSSHKAKAKRKTKKKKKNTKKGESEYSYEEEEEEEEEEEGIDGKLCCLQALKFSTGKMNLGIGRRNLVRISKAIKGFGWLHHVASRHGEKVVQVR